MARPYRIQAENYQYHITNRGNNKKEIFTSNWDYKKFLEYLVKAKNKFLFYILAYALMPTHYHLHIKTTQANLSKIMHYLNTAYTISHNRKHETCGHLFQGRYKSIVVDEDNYFLRLTRYIHLNPVKAKIVEHPGDYRWSSYNCYIKKMEDEIVDQEVVDRYLDMTPAEYERFVLADIGKNQEFEKNIYAGSMLGETEFIKETIQDLNTRVESDDYSFRKDLNKNVSDPYGMVSLVAKRYGKNAEDLYAARKQPSMARKIAIYLLKTFTGLSNKEIGKAFDISYSAVSKAAVDIERKMETDMAVRAEMKGFISHFKG